MRGAIIMKYAFPAVFYPDDNAVAFHFYDAENWHSFGDDMAEAIEAAEDILGGRLMRAERDGKEIPKASKLDEVVLKPNETVRMIYADTEVYAKKVAEQLKREEIEAAANPIKAVRESKGWTIKEFADFLNAPYRTIQDWNNGEHFPPRWIQDIIVEKIYSA